MYYFRKWVVLAVLILPLPLRAEEVLTLDVAVAEVLVSNPDVRAARYRVDEARGKIPQAKALPDPDVGVRFFQVPTDTWDVTRGMETDYILGQKIPFPGKRHIRGKAARLDAKAVAEGSRGRVQDVLLDLKETYYDLYRLDRSIEVNRETVRILRQFLGSTETRYATGQTTADAPLKAQVEFSKLENEGLGLEQERLTHMSHLKALLNRSGHDDIRLPSRLEWPRINLTLEEVVDRARAARPELAALRAMKERDRARLTGARQGLIPDFSVGLEYDKRVGQQDAWTGTAMISLPIFFWNRNRGELKEAKAAYRATEAEQQSMEIHTIHEIEEAYGAVATAGKQRTAFESRILPAARTTLESARQAYTSNKVDFLTLIDALRTYKELQMSHIQVQARYGQSLAMLERLVGEELQ